MSFGKAFKDYFFITIGSLITAVALVSFLIPNNVIAGGVSGLAIIFYRLFGWWVGIQMLAYNAVLFVLAFMLLGVGFGVKSIYSAVILSVFIDALQHINIPVFVASSVQDGGLLVAIYGGALAGIGMGMVLWRGASTGGTDIIAMILSKYLHLSTGIGLLLADTIITTMAIVVFGPLVAMYGIITIFTTSKTIDGILEGFGNTRTAFIITEKYEEVKSRILKDMERGVTLLNAVGGFTGKERPVLMVSLRRRELGMLRRIIKEEDPNIFMIVVNNAEVFGEGFKHLS
ncbi:hypothetical protein AT15_07975 [Kosmotoga arenicorallina S304]|uniref:DUF2179 domain-containing protein n=1 Tax=Kosmotoga arenicorallina S304 TaxID=1453497 RepID=A0A182C7V6_9BACT|nr:YitT family protein [Kosmotoga arenicorallina]OAA31424.1 hypothetical protein AT15_07975 [Kosmotoga arenicorallina S304]